VNIKAAQKIDNNHSAQIAVVLAFLYYVIFYSILFYSVVFQNQLC